MFNMQDVYFKTDEEALIKLKEVGILSQTKKVSDLSEIIYKEKNKNNKIKSYKCQVLGYSWKKTNPDCINKIYENLIVKSNNKVFHINIDYLKEMQKNKTEEEKKERIQKGHFALLVTGPRKGVIVKITNMKLNPQEDILLTAIQKGFNDAMKTNYTKHKISQIYTDLYDILEYNEDFTEFKLIKDFSQCSLGHKTNNYKFIESSFSIAEINNKNHKRVVAIDFKTATAKKDSVFNIGFVVQEDNKIKFEKNILINPKCEFSKRRIKLYNINPIDIANCPDWSEAWPEVEQYITPDTLVVAHNLRTMELLCIREECKRYNMQVPKFANHRNQMAYDTVRLAKSLLPNAENYKLSTLTEMYNIELEQHNTLSNAKACLELFNILQNEV